MADKKLHCAIVTPERAVLETEADRVVAPAHDGEVGILPGHARFLAKLGAGECRVISGGSTERLFVDGGFLQVADDRVTILTDRACAISEIDLDEGRQRVESARQSNSGEALAEAKRRLLAMERVKRSRAKS
jgi:F-type H+-transporting ATPase subunit epsilon